MRETTINETLKTRLLRARSIREPRASAALDIRYPLEIGSTLRSSEWFVRRVCSACSLAPRNASAWLTKSVGLRWQNGSAQTALALETELRDSGIVLLARAGQHDRLGNLRHAGVGCLPSAFELLGERRYVRAQAAQASNIWLENTHVDSPRQRQNRIERPACSASSMLLLWSSSAIGVWFLLDFGRQFNKSPDCFSTRREVGLTAAPVVYRPQKMLGHSHLKRAILGASRWAATRASGADHFLY
jgi:hypothetical protein